MGTDKESTMNQPVYPSIPLPPVLKKRLQFGNREQIEAIYDMENTINQKIEMDKSGRSVYVIDVCVESDFQISVIAATEEAALEKAKHDVREMNVSGLDLDFHFSINRFKRSKE